MVAYAGQGLYLILVYIDCSLEYSKYFAFEFICSKLDVIFSNVFRLLLNEL